MSIISPSVTKSQVQSKTGQWFYIPTFLRRDISLAVWLSGCLAVKLWAAFLSFTYCFYVFHGLVCYVYLNNSIGIQLVKGE